MTVESTRKIDSEDGNMNRKMSAMEQVEAKTGDIKISSIEFKCIPFNGLEERTFIMRLSSTTNDNVNLKLRISQLESEQEALTEEFKDKLEESLSGSDVSFYIGTFNPSTQR